jgi:predicted  nucleic acid-binding Zn-ribbon protein
VALKKPSDLFSNKSGDNNIPIIESDSSFREELIKVESLSEQVIQLQQELSQKVIKSDLESLVLSQINTMQENFECLQNDFKKSNKKDIVEFKERVTELTEIVGNLVENELPKYKKQVTKNEVRIDDKFGELKEVVEENIFGIREEIDTKVNDIVEVIANNIDNIGEDVDTFKNQVSTDISSIKADVVISEQHIKNIDKYLQEHHQELVELKEEVFDEIEKLSVGNLQENLERLEKKIDFIKETYSKIEPEVIVKEVIKEGLFNEPPDTKNSDPLTPLDQKFVTLDQLQKHYSLFINRIQQQLSTLGGGGETQLRYLDDIVGIQTNSAAYDGKYLQWNSVTNKAEFVTVSGGGGSQTLNQTLGLGNTSSLGMSVGIITTTSINFASGGLLGDPYGDGGFGLKSAPNQYATIASNNLQQYIQVDNTTTYIGTGYGSTTGTYDWQFKKDGSTQFPNGLILAPTGQSITLQSDQYSQLFWMNADQTVGPDKFTNVDFFVASGYAILDIGYRDGASNQQYKSWGWSLNGLQFPDLTIQDTAFTGYAPTAGIATVAQGLTETPNISVGVITATDYRIQSVAEKTTIVGLNTANLVYNTGGGNIAICTNPSGDITLNVTGIPTDSSFDNYSLAFSVIVTNAGTARSCTAINLNGVSRTIKWFGGSLAAAISGVTTSNGYDVYSFTGINTVGSASTTANYIVLGSVNGSYR